MNTTENVNINLNVKAEDGIKSIRQIRQEIATLTKEMESASGDRQKALAAQIGQLRNDLKDVKAEMNAMDPGELLSGWIKFGHGAVGAFAGITGALTLFGVENEKLQAIEKKSMVLIQTMMGLEQARQLLIDQGGLKQLKALTATTAAQIKKIFVTKAETAATVGAESAQMGLNAAMVANPIGAVIAAIALLTVGLTYFISSANEAASVQRQYNDVMKETDEITKKLSKSMDDYIRLRKEQGASEEELYDLQINKLDEFKINQIAALKEILWNTKNLTAEEKAEFQKKMQNWSDLTKQERDEMIKQYGNMKNLTDEQKNDFKERLKTLEQTNDDIAQLNHNKNMLLIGQDKEAQKLRIENMAEGRAKEIAMADLQEKEALGRVGANNTLRTQIIEAHHKKINEINKKWDDIAKKREEEKLKGEKTLFDNRKKFLEETEKLKIEAINDEYRRAYAQAAFEQDLAFKRKEEEVKSLKYSKEEELKVLNEFKEAYNKVYVKKIEEIDENYRKAKAEKDEKSLQDVFDRMAEIDKNRNEEAIRYNTTMASLYEEGTGNRIKYETDAEIASWNEKKKTLQEGTREYEAEYKAHQKRLDDIEKQGQKRRKKWIEKDFQERIETINEYAQAFGSKLNEITSTIMQFQKQAVDNQLNEINKVYDQQKSQYDQLLEDNLISQEEYNDKTKTLEEEKARKEKDLKHKAFEQERTASIVTATINGIVAAVAALATAPVWLGIVMSALVGGLAVAQIALISSQKNPYARGGLIPGKSHAAGGETIEAEGGEVILNKKAMSVPVYRDLANMINTSTGGASIPSINGGVRSGSANNSGIQATVDSNAIAAAVISSIKSIPVMVSERDITGTQRRVQVIQTRTTI